MDYQMSDDDPEGAAAMLHSQQNAPRCPYRAGTEAPHAAASSQHSWTHNPHFHAGHMGGMPYAGYVSPNAYWGGNQAQQQHPLASRQPHVSHQTRPSSSSTNSEFGGQENRSHGQTQIHHQHRQSLEENRPPMPRVFSSPDPRHGANNANGQGAQNGATQTPSSSTSSPTHNPAPNHNWQNPYSMDSTGRPATYNPHPQFLPRPPQFNLQQTIQGQQHPRQLPQPNQGSSGATGVAASFLSYQGRNHQMSPSGQTQMPLYYGAFGVPVTNTPSHIIEAHQRQHLAQTEAVLAAAQAQAHMGDDSDDDSEADDDDDEDTDSSPPRMAYARTAGGRSFASDADRDAYLRAQEVAVNRERQRAARRAQMHNVKSIADPSYVACLEKVDLETLTGDEITCMICYNDYGVKNPDGQIEAAVRLSKCKHILGENCLKKWFEDSDSCPYCRDKVPSIQKNRLSLARLAQEEIGGRGPASRLIARYAAITEAQRAGAGAPSLYNDRQLHYAQYVDASVARAIGGTRDLARAYTTREELEARMEQLRGGSDRLGSMLYPNRAAPAYQIDPLSHQLPDPRLDPRERYERMYQRRDEDGLARFENYGAALGALYGPPSRAVQQSERRRQARDRTANRGAIRGAVNISAGSIANGANHGTSVAASQPVPYAGYVPNRASPTSPSAGRGSHRANSSWDSNSSAGVGPRSITPHPTVLDNMSQSPTNLTLNPAAPVWNGSLLRQSHNNQQQPTNPPAPDSPSRALFGYHYQSQSPPARARTGSMPGRPAFDVDPREVNPDNWRDFGASNNSGNNDQTNASSNRTNNQAHAHGNVNNGTTNAPSQSPTWNIATQAAGAIGGATGAAALAGLFDFDGLANDQFAHMEMEQLDQEMMAGLNDEGF